MTRQLSPAERRPWDGAAVEAAISAVVSRFIEPVPDVVSLLTAYVRELYEWNPHYKLLSTVDGADPIGIVERHIADSLRPLAIFARELGALPKARLYDLGSGAGLPGIPLALALRYFIGSPVAVTLVEKGGRRVRFLNYVVARLRLTDVTVQECDFRRIDLSGESSRTGGADPVCVTFRALSEFTPEFLGEIAAVFPRGSVVLAYRSASEAPYAGEVMTVPGTPGEPERRIVRMVLDRSVP